MQGGFLRTLLGDPEQATVRAGYAMSYNQERIDRFENSVATNPGGLVNVVRNLTTGYPLVLPGESHPLLFSQRNRARPAGVPGIADLSDRGDDGRQRRDVPAGSAHTARAFVLGRLPAVDRSRHGRRSALRRQQEPEHVGGGDLERAQHPARTASSTSSGWRRRTSRRISPPAAAPRSRTPARRGRHRLPIYLGYLSGRNDAANTAAYTATQFTNAAFLARLSTIEPEVTERGCGISTRRRFAPTPRAPASCRTSSS